MKYCNSYYIWLNFLAQNILAENKGDQESKWNSSIAEN